MAINWGTSKEDWIGAVRAGSLQTLQNDQRFNSGTLAARFDHEVTTWQRTRNFPPLIEIGNEIAAAVCLVGTLEAEDRLEYEPRFPGTDKRIDFHRLSADGQHAWIEVKTVAPQWRDDAENWARLLAFAADFPENAQLVVDREWAGAAVGGQYLNTRWTMINRAATLEETAALLPHDLRGPVSLLFCARNHDWRADELEDFADFYRTGRGRQDDPLRNAVDRFMVAEGLEFQRTLAGFHFMARRDGDPQAFEFEQNVVGPVFGR